MEKPELVFGQRITPHEPRVKIQTEVIDPSLKFDWEINANNSSIPYYLQGDDSMYTKEALEARDKLKDNAIVSKSISNMWLSFTKDKHMCITKKEYTDVLLKICKVLIPEFNEEQCTAAVDSDWIKDSNGRPTMDYKAFHEAFFELADLWCPNIDSIEYAHFLETLKKRITVRTVRRANGVVEKYLPQVKLVLLDEKESKRLKQSTQFENESKMKNKQVKVKSKIDGRETKVEESLEKLVAENEVSNENEGEAEGEVDGAQGESEDISTGMTEQEAAAAKLQALARGHRDRKKVKYVKVKKSLNEKYSNIDEEEKAKRDKATVKIQAIGKGHRDRKRVKKIKKEKAATQIQSLARARKSRKRVKQIKADNARNAAYASDSEDEGGDNVPAVLLQEEGDGDEEVGEEDEEEGENTNEEEEKRNRTISWEEIVSFPHIDIMEGDVVLDMWAPLEDIRPAGELIDKQEKEKFLSIYKEPSFAETEIISTVTMPVGDNSFDEKETPSPSLEIPKASEENMTNFENAKSIENESESITVESVAPYPPQLLKETMSSFWRQSASNIPVLNIETGITTVRESTPLTKSSSQPSTPISIKQQLVNRSLQVYGYKSSPVGKPMIENISSNKKEDEKKFEDEVLSNNEQKILPMEETIVEIKVPEITEKENLIDPFVSTETTFIESKIKTPIIYIIGKSGCGKTVLAQKLAQEMQMAYFEPKLLIENILKKPVEELNDLEKKIVSSLLSGLVIGDDSISQLFQQNLASKMRENPVGIILDGFATSLEQYDQYKSVLPQPTNVIDIVMENDDLLLRHSKALYSPEQNKSFSIYDRQARQKISMNEEGEQVVENIVPELPELLIRKPEDGPKRIARSLRKYEDEDFPILNFGNLITVNGNQTPETLLSDVLHKIRHTDDARFSQFPTVLQPRQLVLPARLFTAKPVQQYNYLLHGTDVDEKAPATVFRKWSLWRNKCPVEMFKGNIADGDATKCAVFLRGKLYICATEENMREFLSSPSKYLENPPHLPSNTKIIIHDFNNIESGESIEAELELKYNLNVINVKKLLLEEAATNPNGELSSFLSQGNDAIVNVSNEKLVSVISSKLDKNAEGWVLTGFPQFSPLTWQTLKKAGMLPSKVILTTPIPPIENVETDEKLISIINNAKLVSESIQSDTIPIELISSSTSDGAEVKKKTIAAVDPFQIRVDDPEEYADNETIMSVLGDAGKYCIVSLIDEGVLIPGNNAFVVKARDALYKFAGDAEKNKFTLDPEKYLPEKEIELPPPRILVFGSIGTGKYSQATQLSSVSGLPVISLAKLLNENSSYLENVNNLAKRKEFEAAMGENGGGEENNNEEASNSSVLTAEILSTNLEKLKINILKDALDNTKTTGCIIIGDDLLVELVPSMIKNKLHPAVVVKMDVHNQEIIDRLLPKRFTWTAPPVKDQEQEDEEASVNPTAEELEEIKANAKTEAIHKLISEVTEQSVKIDGAMTLLTEAGIDVLSPVKGTGSKETVFKRLLASLDLYLGQNAKYRISNSKKISMEEAQALINSGYASISKFGPYNPVSLVDRNKIERKPTHAIMYRNSVYFTNSDEDVTQFSLNPVKYIQSQPPSSSVTVPKIAVIGPPLSGKTSLANYFVDLHGVVLVTPEMAIEEALRSNTYVGNQINTLLVQGKEIGDDLTIRAVVEVLRGYNCQTRGYVLDGFPKSRTQAETLEEEGFVPQKVFEINFSIPDIIRRSAKCSVNMGMELNENAISSVVAKRLSSFNSSIGSRSKWWITDTCGNISKEALFSQEKYNYAVEKNLPACIKHIPIHSKVVSDNAGSLSIYCPIAWATERRLIDCSNMRDNTVEWKGLYYFCSSQVSLNEFLSNPVKYLNGQRLPKDLPVRIPFSMLASIQIETQFIAFGGFCPVSYSSISGQKDWNSLTKGNSSLLVSYQKQIFSFKDENNLIAFLETPNKFSNMRLPPKLPPQLPPPELGNSGLISMVGFLEKSISKEISDGLIHCGGKRLKYPSLSIKDTMKAYFALHLKSINEAQPQHIREKYTIRQQEFEKECNLALILSSTAPRGPGAKASRALSQRSIYSFANNIDLFDELLQINPQQIVEKFSR